METEQAVRTKWQPVMLVATRRVECACGALAVFVLLEDGEDGADDWTYSPYCQDCWQRESEAEGS